mgnify:CR=1 FL=1
MQLQPNKINKSTSQILNGEKGAPRDAVVFNAAAAIAAFKGGQDQDLAVRIADGVKAAQAAIDSGKAKELLANWVKISNQLVTV